MKAFKLFFNIEFTFTSLKCSYLAGVENIKPRTTNKICAKSVRINDVGCLCVVSGVNACSDNSWDITM